MVDLGELANEDAGTGHGVGREPWKARGGEDAADILRRHEREHRLAGGPGVQEAARADVKRHPQIVRTREDLDGHPVGVGRHEERHRLSGAGVQPFHVTDLQEAGVAQRERSQPDQRQTERERVIVGVLPDELVRLKRPQPGTTASRAARQRE